VLDGERRLLADGLQPAADHLEVDGIGRRPLAVVVRRRRDSVRGRRHGEASIVVVVISAVVVIVERPL
jgi:hypothetical protein